MAHTPPEVTAFRLRYPAFVAVPDQTVQYWLTDAERIVTTGWIEADYDVAIMAHAAHEMALAGLEGGSGGGGGTMEGVTSFRSASMSVTFSDAHAARLSAGGWEATRYGREFLIYLRRNRGGPVVAVAAPGACC